MRTSLKFLKKEGILAVSDELLLMARREIIRLLNSKRPNKKTKKMSTEKDEIPEKKKMKMRLAIEEATKFRNELAKKIGITHPSAAEIIREDRDHGH